MVVNLPTPYSPSFKEHCLKLIWDLLDAVLSRKVCIYTGRMHKGEDLCANDCIFYPCFRSVHDFCSARFFVLYQENSNKKSVSYHKLYRCMLKIVNEHHFRMFNIIIIISVMQRIGKVLQHVLTQPDRFSRSRSVDEPDRFSWSRSVAEF